MKILITLFVLIASMTQAHGQEIPAPQDEVLRLQDAVQIALKSNRMIQVAALELRKAEDGLAAVRTRRLPSFDVNLLESQLLTRPSFAFPRGAFGTFPPIGPVPPYDTKIYSARRPVTLALARVIQPLSQLYKVGLGVSLQELNCQLAREKLRAQERSVANGVKRLYYSIIQAQSGMEAMEKAIQLYRELERVLGEYVAQQTALKADGLEAGARLVKAEYDALTLRNSLATAREQLNALLGRDIATRFQVDSVQESPAPAEDPASLKSLVLERRPEVAEARLKLKQAEYDRRLKKSEKWPDVSLAFNYLSMTNVDVLPRNLAAVGLLFSWSPFDWGRSGRELAEKARTIQQADTALRETEAQVLMDANSRFRKYQESIALLRVSRLAEEVAQERLRVAMEKYRQQAVQAKDLLQVQAQHAEAGNQYRQALLSCWAARADYEKAIGEEIK